jgi:antitoxin ParD1/3/4
MSTMNISLPAEMKEFIDEQVAQQGYSTSSEYVRELVRRERDRLRLRALILEGMSSPPSPGLADKAYFDRLRDRARKRAKV